MLEELKPHLVELRNRLGKAVAALIVAFFVCFTFWEPIMSFITVPLKNAMPEGSKLVFTKVQEPFFTAMKISLFTGLLASLPVIFWQFWRFVAPGLYENEKRLVLPFVASATLMFALGAAFCYCFVTPVAFDFLVNFGQGEFTALPSVAEYVSFFTKLVIAFGTGFELPVFIFFLAKLGLVDDAMLRRNLRVAILIIFIFAAIMTPPDVFSQFLMAIPLVGLYLISILIAAKVNPADRELESDESADE